MRSLRIAPLWLSIVVLAGCSQETRSGGAGAGAGDGGMPTLARPAYPNRPAPQPVMAPSTFSQGQPVDWEDGSAQLPERVDPAFANTTSFDQTARWIQETMDRYLEARAEPWLTTISDLHFRGCLMEWDERTLYAKSHPPQVNEYMHSVNLGDLDLSYVAGYGASSSGDRLSIQWAPGENKVISRSWENVDGSWRMKGERADDRTRSEFPLAKRDRIAKRMACALLHAARLCGASARR